MNEYSSNELPTDVSERLSWNLKASTLEFLLSLEDMFSGLERNGKIYERCRKVEREYYIEKNRNCHNCSEVLKFRD